MPYQLEVKLSLVRLFFNPADGWRVTVDVDPMELGKGGQQSAAKRRRAARAHAEPKRLGVSMGRHDVWGPVDVVADHPEEGTRLIEVEGSSRRQPDQALYSAIGQLVLMMQAVGGSVRYGLAVPDERRWRHQLGEIPLGFRKLVNLELYALRESAGTRWLAHEQVHLREVATRLSRRADAERVLQHATHTQHADPRVPPTVSSLPGLGAGRDLRATSGPPRTPRYDAPGGRCGRNDVSRWYQSAYGQCGATCTGRLQTYMTPLRACTDLMSIRMTPM
jgi:hypothetical protein